MRGKKDLLVQTLSAVGADRLLRAAGVWRGLVILNYHRIGNPLQTTGDRGVFSAQADAFDEQVRWLKTHADLVSLDELGGVIPDLRSRAVLITFDDGYRDNYELAFPVLQRHRAPATFFLTSGFLDDQLSAWWDEIARMVRSSERPALPPGEFIEQGLSLSADDCERTIHQLLSVYKKLPTERAPAFLGWLGEATGVPARATAPAETWMTWDMVREMRRGGMSFGGHTMTHPVLARLSADQQREEILGCKRRIEAELGEPIEAFSYPVGSRDSFDGATRASLEEAGFRWAFSFSGGYARRGALDPYDIPRTAVEEGLLPSRFRALLTLPQLFA